VRPRELALCSVPQQPPSLPIKTLNSQWQRRSRRRRPRRASATGQPGSKRGKRTGMKRNELSAKVESETTGLGSVGAKQTTAKCNSA